PSVLDRVLESTSTKEKMAKYQAAVSKQSSAPPDVPPEAPADQKRTLRLSATLSGRCWRSGELRLAAGKHLLQAPFQPAVQSQGQLRRGLRPPAHKELWEPRTDGDEDQEPAKPREQEEPAAATRPAQESSEEPPPEEESPPVKVTDLTALLESRAQARPGAAVQARERAMEARRLRVAWPPPAAEDHAGTTALSPLTEGTASGRPFKAKWPPEDEGPSVQQSSDRAELVTLRRSSSLKERSRPFTLAAR
ncbi:unnamed protein product, partial [Tetraodon nigroviridis]